MPDRFDEIARNFLEERGFIAWIEAPALAALLRREVRAAEHVALERAAMTADGAIRALLPAPSRETETE